MKALYEAALYALGTVQYSSFHATAETLRGALAPFKNDVTHDYRLPPLISLPEEK